MGGRGEWLKTRLIDRSTELIMYEISELAWKFYVKALHKNVEMSTRDCHIFLSHVHTQNFI